MSIPEPQFQYSPPPFLAAFRGPIASRGPSSGMKLGRRWRVETGLCGERFAAARALAIWSADA